MYHIAGSVRIPSRRRTLAPRADGSLAGGSLAGGNPAADAGRRGAGRASSWERDVVTS